MAQRGATVDATDVNAKRVALACRWNPHARVRFHIMPGERLSFADNSFDKCVSICVLEHIGDDDAVLREVARVLRPGGRFVLSCDSLSNSGISEHLRLRHAKRYAVRRFYTRNSLRARLERAGLTLVRSEFVLTTPVSLAITRFTYRADDLGRLPFGWVGKYPAIAVAGSLGILVSRASERLMPRTDEGLTLIAEAVKPH
jgi:SAM-dependent methyltransferase